MKSMKLSAIVLGLVAAGVFAEPEAAAAPAAEAQQAEAAAAPATEATQTDSAATAAAAPAAAPAAVADTSKAAPAAAPAAAPVATAVDTSISEYTPLETIVSEKGPEYKVSGFVDLEADVMNYNADRRFAHSFASTFDLNFDIKFTDNWSAFVGIEADGAEAYPDFYLNGAYVQYQNSLLGVKIGDMTYSEGAFNYYRYDDATYYAAGMKEQSLRGVELDIVGVQAAIGFSANENTLFIKGDSRDQDVFAFFTHLAYDLEFAGQRIRPYVHYKGYDLDDANDHWYNQFRAGLFMEFSIMNLLYIHTGYGFADDVMGAAKPVVSHTFLIEPTLTKGAFSLTGSVFYALLADNPDRASEIDVPERFYIYAEPAMQFLDQLKVGVMGEYHTNTLDSDNDNNEFAYIGPKIYFNPNKFISMQMFGAIVLPLGDGDGTGTVINYKEDDEFLFDMGAEVIFSF